MSEKKQTIPTNARRSSTLSVVLALPLAGITLAVYLLATGDTEAGWIALIFSIGGLALAGIHLRTIRKAKSP